MRNFRGRLDRLERRQPPRATPWWAIFTLPRDEWPDDLCVTYQEMIEESDRIRREHFEKNYLPDFREQWARLGMPDPGTYDAVLDSRVDWYTQLLALAATPTPEKGEHADG